MKLKEKEKEHGKEKDAKCPSGDAAGCACQKSAITETIETNYMPYVMSVIISRAIPEIDGFKPAHRKILYTMYKMGLMSGPRTKSANVVGQSHAPASSRRCGHL